MAARHIVFGTAGHVDHGKSALVKALTGTDPDRLAEEKAREMTIDLGFAFLPLPGLEEPVAIVDVPGHEMFIRNMVAGATGVDAAIFVVAADEGVKPQTVEHLEVLQVLGVKAGVVALTKADKVGAEAVARISEEVGALVRGTFLEAAPRVAVSAVTGEGLDELVQELARVARSVETRSAEGVFRLPIDRVFTIRGAGTVVTGTVVSGSLSAGERVECLPGGRLLRARQLQVAGRPVDRVDAGQRAAVNLPEAEKEELARGDVLATPGALAPTWMLDVRVTVSARMGRRLGQRARLRVHHGTKEVMARIVLLEGEELRPGETMLAQLRLEGPVVAVAGDRFVLRWYSPPQVIGGGVVVDPHPPKRRRGAGARELAEREASSAAERLAELLEAAGTSGLVAEEARRQLGLSEAELGAARQELEAEGRVTVGRKGRWLASSAVEGMAERVVAALADLHRQHPLLWFISLGQVVGRVEPDPREQEALRLALERLGARGTVVAEGNRLRLAHHRPRWEGRWAQGRERILGLLAGAGLAVPGVQELAARSGLGRPECEEVLQALAESGEVVRLTGDMYLHAEVMAACRRKVQDHLRQHGRLSIAEARELLGASRKYLLPFLETLDREGVTVRQGDYRTPGRRAGEGG